MNKEIGSDFWEIPVSKDENDCFPNETKWFLSGRHALEYIVIDSEIKSVSMPKWCCSSMIEPFIKNNVSVVFYDDAPNEQCDAVFLMDYFGFSSRASVSKGYKGTVIRDLTHSIFSKTYSDADYYFGSLRKWAGFITGGFAWGKWKKSIVLLPCDNEYVSLRKKAMELKKAYLEGDISEKSYLGLFKKASERLNFCGLCSAYDADVFAARHFDVDGMKRARRKNAKVLIERIGCIYPLGDNDCPLFVPIKAPKRDALRKYLIDHDVYLPVHWPNSDLDGLELSLVCDQRYNENDMNHICDLIQRFYDLEGGNL